jgi:hypothetical protein
MISVVLEVRNGATHFDVLARAKSVRQVASIAAVICADRNTLAEPLRPLRSAEPHRTSSEAIRD